MDDIRRWRVIFRRWRRTRPFWGGALLLIGAGIILSVPTIGGTAGADFTEGIAGVSGVLIALLMGVAGLTMWISPSARVFAGVAGCFLSLVAVVASNLGGFLFGTIFGIVGAAMAIAWTPASIAELKAGAGGDGSAAEPAFTYAAVGAGPQARARDEVGGAARALPGGSAMSPSAPARSAQVTAREDLFDPFPDASFSAAPQAVASARETGAPDPGALPDELLLPASDAGEQGSGGGSRRRWGVGGE